MGFFKKKEYVFLICQDKVLVGEEELKLKNEAFRFINESLDSLFSKRQIKYADDYMSQHNNTVYSFLTTFDPKGNILFLAWLHELYAFSIKRDENIFKSYNYKKKELSSATQKIVVYRFKI